jgi:hypothetical protein
VCFYPKLERVSFRCLMRADNETDGRTFSEQVDVLSACLCL